MPKHQPRDPESKSPYGVGNGPLPPFKPSDDVEKLVLPWPHRDLSPNSRKDRRHTGEKRKGYKEACWALAKAAQFRASHLDITFCPPDGRRRDLDNMLGAIKYGLDGVALAMGHDDSEWELTIRKGEPCRPDGCVIIRAGEML